MPPKIILNKEIVEDSYTLVESTDRVPDTGNLLVNYALWPELKPRLADHRGKLGLQITGETEPAEIAQELANLDLIAIHFPSFRDGRGYSLARILREQFHFKGELRATGDILRDQLFYLYRCGFNSFAVRDDRCIEEALTGLNDFSVTYQADVHEKRPIYKRRFP